MAINILDSTTLPEELDLLDEYGVDEPDRLLSLFTMVMNHVKKIMFKLRGTVSLE